MYTTKEKIQILKQAQKGNLEFMKILKRKNPNFHWSEVRYETGDTILHCACRLGHLETVEYLLNYQPSGVNLLNRDDKTALHEAAQFSHPSIVRLLLEKGAHVNALKRSDWTPLMLACTKANLETVIILINNGAIVNYCNKDGWSALHLSARQGTNKIFELLIDKGAIWGARTKNGRTCLHVASLHGHLPIIQILIELGANIDEGDNCGNTPLHEAILGGDSNIHICHELVASGANINKRNNADFNLLQLASSEGHLQLIQLVINQYKCDVNWQNCNGLTALHCAARNKHKRAYHLLVTLGGDVGITDKFGRSPLDYFE